MKKTLIAIIIIGLSTFALATNTQQELDKKERIKKHLELDIEKEKKYAREQTFYNYNNYDFKGSEVNEATVDTTNEIEVDDLDMDSVYD